MALRGVDEWDKKDHNCYTHESPTPELSCVDLSPTTLDVFDSAGLVSTQVSSRVNSIRSMSDHEESSVIDVSVNESFNSIPFLDSTPLIINDICTPDKTLDIVDRKATWKSPSVTSDDLLKALTRAGYHQATIKATIKRLNNEPASGNGKGRPLTNVFHRGSVFTLYGGTHTWCVAFPPKDLLYTL